MDRMTGLERVKAVVAGQPVDRLPLMPITMMFAADLIDLPYRRYATEAQKLVEGQIAVAERFDFDHVSAISDPTREAGDCGATIEWFDDQPPAVNEADPLLADKARLDELVGRGVVIGPRMADRIEAIRLFRQRAGGQKLIEGWIEGPCAEAADLRGINQIMMDFIDDEAFVESLMDFIVDLETAFALGQVEAGADLIGIGDAAASLVGPVIYRQFVQPRQQRLVDAIHQAGAMVRLHICGNTTALLGAMGQLGCEIVDLDFMVDMAEARRQMGQNQVLLGNIDPVRVLRNGRPQQIHQALAACHQATAPRYIVGAGCEVPRDTPFDNVVAMTEYARTQEV
jgi:MtaA/CmuA family methyltransferase